MENGLLTILLMSLTIVGKKTGDCSLCGRRGKHRRLMPSITIGQWLELLVCHRCHDKVTDAVYDPVVAKFLALVADDAMKLSARLTQHREAEQKKALAQGFEDAIAMLVRALDGKQGSAVNKVALIMAVRRLIGVGLADGKALVERGMERAAKPLELPTANGVPVAVTGK